jgi:hypothetical protein
VAIADERTLNTLNGWSSRNSIFVVGVRVGLLISALLMGWVSPLTWSADAGLMTQAQEMQNEASIILNGGFESGKSPWWGAGEVVRNNAAQGQAALQLAAGYAAQDKRPVEAGKHYRVSMQIRSDAAPEGSVFVQLSYRGNGVDPGWRGPSRVKLPGGAEPALFVTGGSHGWQRFSLVVEAPTGADQQLLYLRKQVKSAGVAYYDDIEVTPTSDPVTTMAALQRVALTRQFLQPAAAPEAANTALAAALQMGVGASPAIFSLAQNGVAQFHIHVGVQADNMTLSVAAELADYLKRISGGDFLPLSNDSNTQAGPLLIIGRDNQLTQRLCPDIPYAKLGNDGFVIRTVGAHVVIAGATPRGTMYGVNWFLDRKLGVKWLSPDFTVVPSTNTIQLAVLNTQQIPRFSYREVLSHEGQDKAYRAHNLLNGESHGPSFLPSPPAIDSWDHGWLAKGGYASFFELLPQNKYAKVHPDWYAGGQLAMMNPQMRHAMAAAIIERLKALPDYRDVWFDIHDQDWGWDMDPASQAFANKHGGQPSAPRLDMVIDVANQVRMVLPGARFSFNAYHWSFTSPKDMTVPDYVLVFPMTIQVDYSTPLNQGRNAQLGKDIAGWNAMAPHVLVWDHITNFSGYYQPTPNIFPIGRSIQWLATLPNVQGYFAEGSWETPNAEFASLRVWMVSRLLWNPDENVASLVAEYCQYYFGAAAPAILRYINLMHAGIVKSGDVLSEKNQVDLAMYDLDFVVTADKLFDDAEAAVAGNPVMLAHVKVARMPVDYVVLLRRNEYAEEAARRKVPWQLDYGNRLARFKLGVKTIKLQQYRQGGDTHELAELLRVERHDAPPPVPAINLSGEDWRVYQDLSFNRYASARIVEDSAASDGAAIRMNGNSSVWAIQFKMDKLPKTGQWILYASVRIEATPGHEQAEGVHVGSYPPMSLFSKGLVGTLNDGQYHLIKVPGGPFRFNADHEIGIYIQPPNQGFVKHVYVDRLVAVKVGAQPLKQP